MFKYGMFAKLCNERNVTPYQVSIATGVATSTLTMWKKGMYTPKADKIMAISKYFGVSIEYFMDSKSNLKTGN